MASNIMSDTTRDDTKTSTANESVHESGDNLKNYGSAPGVVEDIVRVVDHKAERALCRRFDLRLLPVLAVMYLFNALDKGNLGNAETDGMSGDLHFKPNEYNLLLSIFFIPYVIFAPPGAMLGKRYSPARVLPILMFCFGSFTLLSASTKNFGGMFALRWFLGMCEAPFFPLVIYYLTTFYRRGELARRLAIFYAASNIANAFSGLIAFGVFQIEGSSIPNWRYLFIIEGGATVLFSIFAFWYLPRSVAEARFLSEDEKALAFHRIQVDSSAVVNDKFRFRDALVIFKHPTTYAFLCIEICLGVPIQGVALFLPQIVQRLGYSPVKTNLYTVAPNVTGAVMLLLLAFCSDAARLRSPFIVLGFLLTFTGFIIYASINDVQARIRLAYFATFMMTWGTSAPSVLLSTWYNNNVADESRRVLLTSIGVPLANLMGLVSSNVFRTRDKPKYMPALVTVAAFGATGACLAALLGCYMWFDNKRRDRRDGADPSLSSCQLWLKIDNDRQKYPLSQNILRANSLAERIIRKIKCGEERPNCIRCTSTGRKCEYTSPAPSRHASTSASSVVPVLDRPLSVSPSGVWLERRAFAHYSQHAASLIAGGLDVDFWRGVVPQVCRSEPAVWDAINAISALFENPDPCFDPVWLRQNNNGWELRPSHSDALRWYSRSLANMRRQIDRGSVDMNVALISCILFICIETLQGRVEEALRLYHQGVSLIFELRAGGTRIGSYTNRTLLEDTIFPIFLRLGTIALSISGVPVSGLLNEIQGHTANKFSSLSSARLAMTALAAEGMIFQRTVEEHFATKGHKCPLPLAFKRKQEDIQKRLAEWHRAYTNLVNSSDPSELPSSVTSLLLSFHAATSIITAVSTEQLEIAYDAYLPQFRLIVEQSAVHLETSAGPNGRQPPFTFEMGPGLSLFLTAIKCRDPWLRRRALQLLRMAPPMQGLYKCPPGATLAEAFMNLEESGTIFNNCSPGSAGSPGKGSHRMYTSEIESTIPITTLIPEESRLHGYCVFRPRDDPWPLGDLDISKWNRGPDQIYLKYSRNRFDEKSNTWTMVHDIVPVDY
ncbi:hypothetical protein CNMCM7691_005188 [Aspergillus felis]|uniref:Major facilitator superfamily (MFS) profile domain-containing protein n=1 Tax=Aspergillus felis TaxID=1287682 RepID=A0A8H6V3G0_9EURO|nr:hypothetical protein CNMCM7691_005188 [Aspergillus felis]